MMNDKSYDKEALSFFSCQSPHLASQHSEEEEKKSAGAHQQGGVPAMGTCLCCLMPANELKQPCPCRRPLAPAAAACCLLFICEILKILNIHYTITDNNKI